MAITLWNNRDLSRKEDGSSLLGWPVGFDRMMDRFFNDFMGEDMDRSQTQLTAFRPKLDLQETEKEFVVMTELPGLDEKNVEVTLEKDNLIIKGEKKCETTKDTKDRYYSERSFGSFFRSVHLPNDIDREHINATFDKGILKVTLPKSADSKSSVKKIKIH